MSLYEDSNDNPLEDLAQRIMDEADGVDFDLSDESASRARLLQMTYNLIAIAEDLRKHVLETDGDAEPTQAGRTYGDLYS